MSKLWLFDISTTQTYNWNSFSVTAYEMSVYVKCR